MAPLCNVMVRCLGFPAQFAFEHPLFWLTPGRSRKAPMLCGYLGTQATWKVLGQIYGEVGLACSPLVTVVGVAPTQLAFPTTWGR